MSVTRNSKLRREKEARFAPMRRANARAALYAWVFSGAILFGAKGFEAFLTLQALAFFVAGAYFSVYVIAQANFLLQRAAAIGLQNLLDPSPRSRRFINGFGIGLLAGGPVMCWIAASMAVAVMFGA